MRPTHHKDLYIHDFERLQNQLLAEKKDCYKLLQKQGLPPIQATVDFLKFVAYEKEHLGIEVLFDVILSGDEDLTEYIDPEGVNKPKPYIYLHAAKLLHVSPQECVVI